MCCLLLAALPVLGLSACAHEHTSATDVYPFSDISVSDLASYAVYLDEGKSYVVIDMAPDETVTLEKLGGAGVPDTDEEENDGPIVTPPHPFG